VRLAQNAAAIQLTSHAIQKMANNTCGRMIIDRGTPCGDRVRL
jgi:hypothetical protein